MKLARFKSDRLRLAVLLLSIGAVLHFAVSCLIWGRFFVAFACDPYPPYRRFLLEGGPAVLLLLCFLLCGWLAWRRRRVSLIVLLVGLAAGLSLFAHDAITRNWQMHAESYTAREDHKTFFYFTWWWYDQRWLGRIGR